MTTHEGIPLSKVSPSFLKANSTSHIWPFSAIAELIDNAYDPDVSAKNLRIDVKIINGSRCLTFQDDGNGMDHDHLLKMLSFGFCEKDAYKTQLHHLPIGHYGNGFKSGSMRLAKDVIVFTVCKSSASVGFLSLSYLEERKLDSVIVPIVEYTLSDMSPKETADNKSSLEAILKYSLYSDVKSILEEFKKLLQQPSGTGTLIILYNLRRLANGNLELDFESDKQDIRNPEIHEVCSETPKTFEDRIKSGEHSRIVETSEYIHSLRAYCTIIFCEPRMRIYIRGNRVKTVPITKALTSLEKDYYKPSWLKEPLKIEFGFFNEKAIHQKDYGVMFYYNNRLIKAYEKLGYQKQPNELGVGVIGVVQANFLTPIHNKQDFLKDGKYNATVLAISIKLNDYWDAKKNGTNYRQPAEPEEPVFDWVQCDQCQKWRRLPLGIDNTDLPDKWYCFMNPDPTHNRCDAAVEEELKDEEKVGRPTYKKQPVKLKVALRKKNKEHDLVIAVREAIRSSRVTELVKQHKQDQGKLAKVSPEHGNGLHAVLSTRSSNVAKHTLLGAGTGSPKKRPRVTDGTPSSDKETSLNYNSAAYLSNEGNASDVSVSLDDLLAPPRSRQQRRSSEESCCLLPTPEDPVIDLSNTDDESELAAQQCSATDNDAKPDIDVLKAAVMNYKDSLVNREVAVKSEFTKEVGVQVIIKEEEETEHMLLKQKHAVLQQHFEKFQHDVFTLLTFLLDDTDIGQEEDIEIAVVELIRANRADGQ